MERTELPVEAPPEDDGGRFAGLSPLALGAGVAVSLALAAGVLVPLYYRRR